VQLMKEHNKIAKEETSQNYSAMYYLDKVIE
jgi:hypothetical protein